MLESIRRATIAIGLAMLLLVSVYVLDRCDFIQHWDANHLSCVETGRDLREGATAAVVELTHRSPSSDLPKQLGDVRAGAEKIQEDLSELPRDSADAARRWFADARRTAVHWGRVQLEDLLATL